MSASGSTGSEAATYLTPPVPGQCHAARCDESVTHLVRVRRISGAWTRGIDYCEPHAHEVAGGMRKTLLVIVEAL